jgi:hypothetical protein
MRLLWFAGLALTALALSGCRGCTREPAQPATRVVAPASAQKAPQGGLSVQVDVDSDAPVVWGESEFARVGPVAMQGDSGDERQGYGLRELVATLVGPHARLVAVKGDGGKTVAVAASDWADGTKVPVLRLNRRGLVKFQWLSPEGAPLPGQGVRGVRELVVHRQ